MKLEYSLYGGNSASLGTAPNSPPNQQIADLAAITGESRSHERHRGPAGTVDPSSGNQLRDVRVFAGSLYSRGERPLSALRFRRQLPFWQLGRAYSNSHRISSRRMLTLATTSAGPGMYAQLAYRDYQNKNPVLASIEVVGRFSLARFSGIDPAQIDLTAFAPGTAPVDRNQYTSASTTTSIHR